MGYCCGQKLTFTPLALFCYGQSMCVIARDQPYYLYESGSTQYGVTVTERYVYCTKCFEALPEEGINLNENPNEEPTWVHNFKHFRTIWSLFQNGAKVKIPIDEEWSNRSGTLWDLQNLPKTVIFREWSLKYHKYSVFRWHRICANYSKKVFPEGFICDSCRIDKNRPKPDNKYTAKSMWLTF